MNTRQLKIHNSQVTNTRTLNLAWRNTAKSESDSQNKSLNRKCHRRYIQTSRVAMFIERETGKFEIRLDH